MKAVIVEWDYKGEYFRYALTQEEFREEFGSLYREGMVPPYNVAETYTIRPMVHVWYMTVNVKGHVWYEFFTDMQWGLPESDYQSGNEAYIDLRKAKSLAQTIKETIQPFEGRIGVIS